MKNGQITGVVSASGATSYYSKSFRRTFLLLMTVAISTCLLSFLYMEKFLYEHTFFTSFLLPDNFDTGTSSGGEATHCNTDDLSNQTTNEATTIEVDSVCKDWWDIVTQQRHQQQQTSFKSSQLQTLPKPPPTELVSLDEVRSILKYWIEYNCPSSKQCRFSSIGQHLLQYAINHNKTLLTVQFGAMDGVSNDPLYDMFVKHAVSKFFLRDFLNQHAFDGLSNWLPVLVEPVPDNYNALIKTYSDITKKRNLSCAVPIQAAVSYNDEQGDGTGMCTFCRFNTSDNAPEKCAKRADWQKFQIGTLDCGYSKKFFMKDYDLCIVQDKIPCSSVSNLLKRRNIPSNNIAMLQADVEGYEYILLTNFLNELPPDMLPPIIHFEHKVLAYQDNTYPLPGSAESIRKNSGNETAWQRNRTDIAMSALLEKGYQLFDQGDDMLAVRV